MWRCTDNKTFCTVLDSVEFDDQGLRETSQERIAIVSAPKLLYERNNKSFGGIISVVVVNCTNTSDFREAVLQMKLMCSFIERSLSR